MRFSFGPLTFLLSLLPPSLMVVPEHSIANFNSVNTQMNLDTSDLLIPLSTYNAAILCCKLA